MKHSRKSRKRKIFARANLRRRIQCNNEISMHFLSYKTRNSGQRSDRATMEASRTPNIRASTACEHLRSPKRGAWYSLPSTMALDPSLCARDLETRSFYRLDPVDGRWQKCKRIRTSSYQVHHYQKELGVKPVPRRSQRRT